MEGDRRLVLLEPGQPTEDEYGEVIPGLAIQHVVWALRMDRGGREGLVADTMVGVWQTRFRVRRDGIAAADHTWTVVDEEGREWDIEAVAEVPMPPRRWLNLYCARST
ncbi:phage head completion protein [Candidatus Palauibacter sp.]|uniref:phage head completion protein n=1 Tax=Candidatus Palauibacter sp. TaxID=3101350 RepID=UPI003CC5DEBA